MVRTNIEGVVKRLRVFTYGLQATITVLDIWPDQQARLKEGKCVADVGSL